MRTEKRCPCKPEEEIEEDTYLWNFCPLCGAELIDIEVKE